MLCACVQRGMHLLQHACAAHAANSDDAACSSGASTEGCKALQHQHLPVKVLRQGCSVTALATAAQLAFGPDATAGITDLISLKGDTLVERLVYVLFIGCILALGIVTSGVLYLSVQKWKNKADEKKELAKFDAEPRCTSLATRPHTLSAMLLLPHAFFMLLRRGSVHAMGL